jgi:hypothetical protein
MSRLNGNSRIPPFLYWVTLLEVVVLLGAGSVLFFLPQVGRLRWVWTLTPFNCQFLGAVYLAAIVPIGMLFLVRRWVLARLVLPMELLFTTILLIVSLFDIGRFDFQRKLPWGWFFLYIGIPLVAIYYLWRYRPLPPAPRVIVPAKLSLYLLVWGILLSLYGAGLLLFPATFSGFWPWKLDKFHAQLYSSVFMTPGLGALILSRAAAAVEMLTLSVMHISLGLFAIVGMVLVDFSVRKVNWGVFSTWLWLGIFAVMLISGVVMLWLTKQLDNHIWDHG